MSKFQKQFRQNNSSPFRFSFNLLKKYLLLFCFTFSIIFIFACSKKTKIIRQPNSFTNEEIKSLPQIIGGEEVKESDPIANYTVALASNTNGNSCSGVLISPHIVLTAAHCTLGIREPNLISIIFNRNLLEKQIKRKVLGVQVTTLWLQFDDSKDKDVGDLALLRFDGDAPKGYQPAEIFSLPISTLSEQMLVVIAGYGNQNMNPFQNLQKLFKATVPLGTSQSQMPTDEDTEFTLPNHEGINACHGDSGGPAFWAANNSVIGIASRSATLNGTINCQEGTIYTSVFSHLDFIKRAKDLMESSSFIPNLPVPQPGRLMPKTFQ